MKEVLHYRLNWTPLKLASEALSLTFAKESNLSFETHVVTEHNVRCRLPNGTIRKTPRVAVAGMTRMGTVVVLILIVLDHSDPKVDERVPVTVEVRYKPGRRKRERCHRKIFEVCPKT
jgi:hypothetical protein